MKLSILNGFSIFACLRSITYQGLIECWQLKRPSSSTSGKESRTSNPISQHAGIIPTKFFICLLRSIAHQDTKFTSLRNRLSQSSSHPKDTIFACLPSITYEALSAPDARPVLAPAIKNLERPPQPDNQETALHLISTIANLLLPARKLNQYSESAHDRDFA